jgi:hypothetical protein
LIIDRRLQYALLDVNRREKVYFPLHSQPRCIRDLDRCHVGVALSTTVTMPDGRHDDTTARRHDGTTTENNCTQAVDYTAELLFQQRLAAREPPSLSCRRVVGPPC